MGNTLFFSIVNKTVFIHRKTEDQFMTYNPPCKECLLRCICLSHVDNVLYKSGYKLYIKEGCDKLFKFLNNLDKKRVRI